MRSAGEEGSWRGGELEGRCLEGRGWKGVEA